MGDRSPSISAISSSTKLCSLQFCRCRTSFVSTSTLTISQTSHRGPESMPSFFRLLMGLIVLTALVASTVAYIRRRKKKAIRSVAVVVFGDLGRSPRICRQAQALSGTTFTDSIALYGFTHTPLPEFIVKDSKINVRSIPLPVREDSSGGICHFCLTLYRHLFAMTWVSFDLLWQSNLQVVLVQCPPIVPYLILLRMICWLKRVKVVIDCHNYGYTLVALNKTYAFLAPLFETLERICLRSADRVLTVTETMRADLWERYAISATCLYDQPQTIHSPTPQESTAVLTKYIGPEIARQVQRDSSGRRKVPILVTSTSYTADERIDLLIEALFAISAARAREEDDKLIALLVITGKGPMQNEISARIQELQGQDGRHFERHVKICQIFTTAEDYPILVGSADLGISLHTSSSGLDFPMKVVDYMSSGLKCLSFDFPALSERIENAESIGFKDVLSLTAKVSEFLQTFEHQGAPIGQKAEKTWTEEWMAQAEPLFSQLLHSSPLSK